MLVHQIQFLLKLGFGSWGWMLDIFNESRYSFFLTIARVKYLTVRKTKNKIAPNLPNDKLKKQC